jgi:hypothetical protein
MSTIAKLTNRSASQGGACTVNQWRVEFASNEDTGWWSSWSFELYAGQEQSINLTQQGFDGRQGQCMRVAAYVAGHAGITHSGWVTSYQPGSEYKFSLVGPSANPGINGPE